MRQKELYEKNKIEIAIGVHKLKGTNWRCICELGCTKIRGYQNQMVCKFKGTKIKGNKVGNIFDEIW